MIYNCITDGSTTQCVSEASTSPIYVNGFSYDGILTIIFLMLIFLTVFFKFFNDTFFGVKQKQKKYE